MSDRSARFVVIAVAAVLLAVGLALDLPRLSEGRFWGDGATYYAMAWSLAEDGDLEYRIRDLERIKREYPEGPQGIFLKRSSGGLCFDRAQAFPWLGRVSAEQPRIYFAKPFAYPAFAALLVLFLGTRGLLVTNALALAATFAAGYSVLRRVAAPGRALETAAAMVFATVVPVYLLWPAPELFNLALIATGLWAWRSDRLNLSAVLLGVATYSKPYNLWLALPLGLSALVVGRGWARGLLRLFGRAAVFSATVLLLFGINKAITGEANYQGGAERKTFYHRFPFEWEKVDGKAREVTFGNSGIWMSTNDPGPRVEGIREEVASQGAEPPRSPTEFRHAFLRNLGYFWVGRFGGAAWYFFPVVLAFACFLALGPRTWNGWLVTSALLVSFFFYLLMIPDNWYGGSGTIGNRYFLNLVPLAFFLVPAGRERPIARVGAIGSLILIAPILFSPVQSSLHHGTHATRGIFRIFPAELTMLNDLSIFSEGWRKKRPVGDTEGDSWRHWPADPKAYYLYFPDDGTFGREEGPGGIGFWLRKGASAEVLLRALEPVDRMSFSLTGGPWGDDVSVRVGQARASTGARIGAGVSDRLELEPGAGFAYKDTFVYVVKLDSRSGSDTSVKSGDPRPLGCFVRIGLTPRPRKPAG